MKTQISIIGCGWLGLPLAINLTEKGHIIKGSTTSAAKLNELTAHKIKPYLIELKDSEIKGDVSNFLAGSDIVIINIPPGLRKNPTKNHVAEIKCLMTHIEAQQIQNVLYISSTSVYSDEINTPTITETNTPNASSNSAKQLIEIEQILQKNSNFKTTILRFSGLFDAKRHPAIFLSGKTNLKNGDAPVNLIHKDDCISIISQLIENNIWGDVFNASNPYHPLKKDYYTNYCKRHNLKLPQFNLKEKSKGKKIEASKLVQLLKYTFKTGL